MDIDDVNKTSTAIKVVLQSVIVLGLVISIYNQNWLNAVVVSGIIVLSTIPSLFARSFSLALPPIFEFGTIAFLFASMFLGELGNFYERFWWWDLALHATSGLLLGILGILMIWILNNNDRISLEMSTKLMCLFAFAFAVAAGTLWEIFEFLMDSFLGVNMQKSGLQDTMTDLIVNGFGALLVSAGGYIYLRKDRRPLTVKRVRELLMRKQPHYFLTQTPRIGVLRGTSFQI